MHLTIKELLDYTDEERAKWRAWFAARGNEPLKIALAGDTHQSVGALILHCFWAECFYACWMRGEVLTNESAVVQQHKDLPADDGAAIFDFGATTRHMMRSFADGASEAEWARVREAEALGLHLEGPARKLIAHILIHEIRHWAQIAFAVRQHGLAPPGDHDLIFSESFGPLIRRL